MSSLAKYVAKAKAKAEPVGRNFRWEAFKDVAKKNKGKIAAGAGAAAAGIAAHEALEEDEEEESAMNKLLKKLMED